MKIRICFFLFYCLIVMPLFSKADPSFDRITLNGHDTSGYFSSFDGTKIYFEEKGSDHPVVLVHGFIVDGESWKKTELYEGLLKAGYRVITLDLRGNGRSDKPHDSSAYANDAEAKDIIGLGKMLGLHEYSVVGYSRGSII